MYIETAVLKEELVKKVITELSTFRGAFRGVRRESGLLTGFFGKGKLREGVLIIQENK